MAARALGCAVIPAGPGQYDAQFETDTRSIVRSALRHADFLKILIDERRWPPTASIVDQARGAFPAPAFPPSLAKEIKSHGNQAISMFVFWNRRTRE